MCSRHEVQQIVSESEHRMEERMYASHNAVAKTVSDLGAQMKELAKKMDESIIDRNSIHGLLEANRQSHERLQTVTGEILEQTKKTNGRTTALETWKAVHIGESSTEKEAIVSIQSTLSRLNWLLITAVVVAVLNLIIKA